MGVAVDARPVVHVALQTSSVITKLQEHVRSVLSGLDGSAVVQLTEKTNVHTPSAQNPLHNSPPAPGERLHPAERDFLSISL